MPSYVNGSEFGRRVGVSRQAIAKNTTHGKLVKAANGKYDLDDPKNYAYLASMCTRAGLDIDSSPGKRKPRQSKPKTKPKPAAKKPKQKPIPPPKHPSSPPPPPATGNDKIRAAVEDEADAKARKAVADADLTEYKARNEKIKLDSMERNILRTDEAEYLFFGFLDKMAKESLRSAKIMQQRIEDSITINASPEDAAREISIMFRDEIGAIIRQTKKDQKVSMIEYYENKGD